jgi:hypothetical protein
LFLTFPSHFIAHNKDTLELGRIMNLPITTDTFVQLGSLTTHQSNAIPLSDHVGNTREFRPCHSNKS